MGFLAQGMGFAGAAPAANSSIGWGATSTGLNAAGSLLSGIGAGQQAGYQAGVAQNNAAIENANAQATLVAGQVQESQSKLRTGEIIGQQKAAQGANGLDVNVGSAAEVRQSTANIGAMDAALIHYNASRAAFGQEQQAANYTAQAALDKKAASGDVLSGVFKAGTSILSGASSISGKYAQYQLSGA